MKTNKNKPTKAKTTKSKKTVKNTKATVKKTVIAKSKTKKKSAVLKKQKVAKATKIVLSRKGKMVKKIIAEKLNIDSKKVVPDAEFIKDLGADSLETIELIIDIEKAFKLNISDAEADAIKTVGDAIEYVETHKKIKSKLQGQEEG